MAFPFTDNQTSSQDADVFVYFELHLISLPSATKVMQAPAEQA
jgi:hypothetical protein